LYRDGEEPRGTGKVSRWKGEGAEGTWAVIFCYLGKRGTRAGTPVRMKKRWELCLRKRENGGDWTRGAPSAGASAGERDEEEEGNTKDNKIC